MYNYVTRIFYMSLNGVDRTSILALWSLFFLGLVTSMTQTDFVSQKEGCMDGRMEGQTEGCTDRQSKNNMPQPLGGQRYNEVPGSIALNILGTFTNKIKSHKANTDLLR